MIFNGAAIFVGSAFFTFGVVCFAKGVARLMWFRPGLDEDEKEESIALLKNALLVDALLQHRKDDIDLDMDYSKYDGTRLPMPSGHGYANACLSHLVPRRFDRNGPWYTSGMEEKSDAVRKYLCKNLASHKAVFELLDACLDDEEKKHR